MMANNLNNSVREFKKHQAYFCHANTDTNWVIDFINVLESDKYRFKCAEYDRDFIGGKYIYDLFDQFMEDSHFIVIVLSPSFLESRWSMFQLDLAIQYSIDNNEGNIVPLVYKTCNVPRRLKQFEPVDATKKGWQKIFVERLCRPAKRYPRGGTQDGRISIEALRNYSTRDVMSEPILDQSKGALSEHNYYKVKCQYIRRGSKLIFSDDRNNGEEISIPYVAQSSGEMAQAKRETHTTNRISAETILELDEKLPVSSLAVGEKARSVRSKSDNCRGRMNADSLLQIHNSVPEKTLQTGEEIQRKRNIVSRKRKIPGPLSHADVQEAHDETQDESYGGSDEKYPGNTNSGSGGNSDRVTKWVVETRAVSDKGEVNYLPRNRRSSGDDTIDDGYNSVEAYANRHSMANDDSSEVSLYVNVHDSVLLEADQMPLERLTDEEADLEKLRQLLPSNILFVGDCVKHSRERNGIGKRRIDADDLLFDASNAIRL